MRCPYCCENVDDTAIVCPRCRYEMRALREALAQKAELEGRVASLTEKLAAMEKASGPAPVVTPVRSSMAVPILMGGLSVAASVGLYWYWHATLPEGGHLDVWRVAFSVLAPPIVGGWFALRKPDAKPETLSVTVAILTVAGLWFVGSIDQTELPYLALIGVGIPFAFQFRLIIRNIGSRVRAPSSSSAGTVARALANPEVIPELIKIIPVIAALFGVKAMSS